MISNKGIADRLTFQTALHCIALLGVRGENYCRIPAKEMANKYRNTQPSIPVLVIHQIHSPYAYHVGYCK